MTLFFVYILHFFSFLIVSSRFIYTLDSWLPNINLQSRSLFPLLWTKNTHPNCLLHISTHMWNKQIKLRSHHNELSIFPHTSMPIPHGVSLTSEKGNSFFAIFPGRNFISHCWLTVSHVPYPVSEKILLYTEYNQIWPFCFTTFIVNNLVYVNIISWPEYSNNVPNDLSVSDLALSQFIFNTIARVTLLKYVSLQLSSGSRSPWK